MHIALSVSRVLKYLLEAIRDFQAISKQEVVLEKSSLNSGVTSGIGLSNGFPMQTLETTILQSSQLSFFTTIDV
eukprot:scaffold4715_cov115-Cylindrotheca_fusiformis.AAC.13